MRRTFRKVEILSTTKKWLPRRSFLRQLNAASSLDAMTHHQTQVLAYFAQKQIHLSQRYIASLLTTFTIAPPPPILPAATLSTFYTAFLNSTLQQSASPQSFLPRSLANQHNTTVSGSTLVQVIHVQDIGTSRLAQLEAVEKALNEAGPQGRRVIDLPVEEEGDDANAQNNPQNEVNEEISVGKSICKLLLEDGKGERVYGMEVKPIEGIKVGMSLGCKVFTSHLMVAERHKG